jgi:nucleotide-binding universal stress UspA family protein
VRAEADIDSPARGLLERAAEWKPDLICTGAPPASRMERLFFGSVCQRVVSHARCSVRIGRTEGRPRPLQLLLAMDGSPGALAAADALLARDWPAGTAVRIVSVRDARFTHAVEAVLSPVYSEPEHGLLASLVKRCEAAGLPASFTILDGVPKEALLAAAAEAHCVFAGASGTGALERLLPGSVSSALSARAACSVEIVRPAHAV